ncbi:hypothetical protein DFH07DRAFT_728213, partial [Mycena maculata]
TDSVDQRVTAFEEFDLRPLRGRSKTRWNRLLLAAPEAWPSKIRSWVDILREASPPTDNNLNISPLAPQADGMPRPLYYSVIQALCEIKLVDKRVYRLPAWSARVKICDFPRTCEEISAPAKYVLWTDPLIQDLCGKNRLQELLAVQLQKWVPQDIVSSWPPRPNLITSWNRRLLSVQPSPHVTKPLLLVLQLYPELIPRVSYPQGVFFILGQPIFVNTWYKYLGAALHSLGFKVVVRPQSLYNDIMQYISTWSRGSNGLSHISDWGLRIILEQTLDYRALKKQVNEFAYSDKPHVATTPDYCPQCSTLPANKRCVQRIEVVDQPYDPDLIGSGISMAPPDECMPKIKFDKSGKLKEPRPILTPDDPRLTLTILQADPERIKRCGRHLLLFVNPDTKEIMDFYLYHAFSDDAWQKLLSHHEELSKVKPLTRGAQFDSYSGGTMILYGPRTAAGGAPADAMQYYAGMTAKTEQGLCALFHHAEDMLIMHETARAVCPEFIRRQTEVTRRLGEFGLTLYRCYNYTSPIHVDPDKHHLSLCCQIIAQCKKKRYEYAFVRLRWRIAIQPLTNSLW